MKRKSMFRLFVCTSLLLCFAADLMAARQPRKREAMTEEARMEYKANDMLTRGLELIEQKQTERGLKLLISIPKMYPQTKIKFKVFLALGQHYDKKREYAASLKQYMAATKAEEKEVQAEAYYRLGITHYNMNNYDKAFVTLRKVTNEYPLSVFANESYYYIGLCHFKLKRWSRAVESLEMVGASVSMQGEGEVLSEAGQRLYVKVSDQDLVILQEEGGEFKATVRAASGDETEVDMRPLGRDGLHYIGSVPTEPGTPVAADNVLQIIGGDTADVIYMDQNTEIGKRNVETLAKIRFVSTASVGFMDGAYRDYTRGIFADQDAFIRVKDLDLDTTSEQDRLMVRIYTQYKVEQEVDIEKEGIDLDYEEEQFEVRDSIDLELVESEAHSGFFTGTLRPTSAKNDADIQDGDDTFWCMQGDEIILEYIDQQHIEGDDALTITYKGKVLVGELQDVKIQVREVDSLELKAKKLLIESNIFLKLGQIFKEVGLNDNASEKAEEGLERSEEVIRMSLKSSLERETVEEAYQSKWELLLVQGKLEDAMAVCNELIVLFPDSSLVDQAMMKIGVAKQDSGLKKMDDNIPSASGDLSEAIKIYQGILKLEKSIMKPESQYRIAQVMEKMAVSAAKKGGKAPELSGAMVAYKKCADLFPESSYAGDSLEKVANYYIQVKDYSRALELMDQIFQDFPDASFLDSMLLKWTIASYRMGDLMTAKEKCNQLLTEYPDSKYAGKAKKFFKVINAKLGG